MFFSFHKKKSHLTKNDFPATIVWDYFFSLRGRRRAAAALLYKVPGTQRVKRRSVRFVCSMSAKKHRFHRLLLRFLLEGPNFKKTQESKNGFPQDSKNKEKTNKTHAQAWRPWEQCTHHAWTEPVGAGCRAWEEQEQKRTGVSCAPAHRRRGHHVTEY